MTASMDSRDGLHRIPLRGGSGDPASLAASVVASSAFFCSSASCSVGGFRVSKQMMPSKQSSSPSFSRTLAAWALSELVKICSGISSFRLGNYRCSAAVLVVTVLADDSTGKMGVKKNLLSSSVARKVEAVSGRGQASASHTAVYHGRRRGSRHSRNHSPKANR